MVPAAASCQGAGDGVLRGLAMTLGGGPVWVMGAVPTCLED